MTAEQHYDENAEVKGGSQTINLVIGWALVSVPLIYGIATTLQRAVQLFQ